MAKIPDKIETWQMIEPGTMARTSLEVPELQPGEVLVEIAGCSVCYTDLSYFYEGVPTVTKPPLTLGHEISGKVVAGDSKWLDKEVIIPAVMPCNSCPICAAGRGNRCLSQRMPGNSLGIYGGFSSHIVVPSVDLCWVEDRGKVPLKHLAVIADGVTSPYQAAVRADVQPGDLTIVIGTGGGLGSYMTQICSLFGAKEVIGISRNPERLKRALKYGATHTISSADKSTRDIRDEFRDYCKQRGVASSYGWKIFECTGKAAGQEIGLELLSFIGKLVLIGFGMQKNVYQLSRLMAFDAEIMGTGGCLPKFYPGELKLRVSKKIDIEPFAETRPMSQIKEVFRLAHEEKLMKRVVLTPDF